MEEYHIEKFRCFQDGNSVSYGHAVVQRLIKWCRKNGYSVITDPVYADSDTYGVFICHRVDAKSILKQVTQFGKEINSEWGMYPNNVEHSYVSLNRRIDQYPHVHVVCDWKFMQIDDAKMDELMTKLGLNMDIGVWASDEDYDEGYVMYFEKGKAA